MFFRGDEMDAPQRVRGIVTAKQELGTRTLCSVRVNDPASKLNQRLLPVMSPPESLAPGQEVSFQIGHINGLLKMDNAYDVVPA